MIKRQQIVFLFSGQGSQYRGMGKALYTYDATFKKCLEQCEVIVQKRLHRSLLEELYAVPEQQGFEELLLTHPAIVAVEVALTRVLEKMGIIPDLVAGNSLGEFAAGVAGGFWSLEKAIDFAIEQAKSIVRTNQQGGMLAVLQGRTAPIQSRYLHHNLFLAGDNFGTHFTLSGSHENLNLFQLELDDEGISYLRLPILYPFHSPLLAGYQGEFTDYPACSYLGKLQPRFVSGLECRELLSLPKDYFWNVVSRYYNYPDLIKYTEGLGTCLYLDLGPSGTSATFVKYNLDQASDSRALQIMTPFHNEVAQLEKLRDLYNR